MKARARLSAVLVSVCISCISATCLSAEPAGPPQAGDRVCYDGHRLVTVYLRTPQQLELLESFDFDIWPDLHHLGPLEVLVTEADAEALAKLGLVFKVRIPNVQELIDRQRAYAPRGRTWFDDYHTLTDILAYMDSLASTYPNLVTLSNIATSWELRNLKLMTITGPPTGSRKPAVFFYGGQHAREWITPPVVCYLADHLLSNYGTDPTVTELVDRIEWHLLPVMNPDGYVYTWNSDRFWRKNRRDNGDGSWGVDLNRNWSVGWGGGGSSSDPYSDIYHGPLPFSEPETAGLRDFIIANPAIEAHMDYHSYSELILWPYGYSSALPPDNDSFQLLGLGMQEEIANVHGHVYTAGPIYSTIYQASGVSVDWAYEDQGIWSLSIELRDTGQYGFLLPPDQIMPTCQENLPAALFLAEWASSAVRFAFPDGLPEILAPNQPTVVAVTVTGGVENLLPASPTLFYRDDPGAAFAPYPLTWLGGDDYQATLPASSCNTSPQYYFRAEGDQGGITYSPAGAPADYYDAQVAQQVVFYENDLSTDPGWSTEGLWAWGTPTGGGGQYGGPDPTGGYTGSNVYGYNLTGDYENSLPERQLTTGPIDCTGRVGVRLSFWRWLGVEQPTYDHAYLRVSNDNLEWATIWQNTAEVTDADWTYQEFDISAVADDRPTVYLRWTMGPTDGAWQYCGWNIDDVRLLYLECLAPDTDGDNVPDDQDNCPNDYNPGQEDTDGDAVGDACDGCPSDPNKIDPGLCGCGTPDTDSDGDLTPDCVDGCPDEPALTAPQGTQEANCIDGIDNDCDGSTDGADPDCAPFACPCGDADDSGGPVDLADFAVLANCFGLSAPAPPNCEPEQFNCSDLDRDGQITLSDFGTFAVLFGTTATNAAPDCMP